MKAIENGAAAKMETIQTVFQQVQALFSQNPDYQQIFPKLDSFDIEFRSIAYEAASMCVALKDIGAENNLTNWTQFLNGPASAHATQVHVGLGWALAQQQLDPIPWLSRLNPMMRYRVMDGYGYYEGIFRRRKSIMAKQAPEFNDAIAISAYYQGIGRSIWYINKGQIDGAKNMIESFPAARLADLWRGLGIAITYVGGTNEADLIEIFAQTEKFKPQLATGAAMATLSRYTSGYITSDAALTCKTWCKQNPEQLVLLTEELRTKASTNPDKAYETWIYEMEAVFE